MYADYFGLKQEPFSIAPDPRLLFMSEQHREALAHLLYGVRGGGGFVLLTGEIGTGKTTVCRSFLEQVPPNCNLAYIFNPKLTVAELLETVCHEFGVALPPAAGPRRTVKEYLDPLNAFLLQSHAAGRNNVLVIDEAQNLAAEVLEQLRLLTNLETSERKLLQIILIGQPELREMLARPELEQLAQRVIARYHLRALSEAETAQYIRHRLDASGLQRPLPFDRGALRRVHALTRGVPRRINLLCDRALLGAYATGQALVTKRIVERAAAEVFPKGAAPVSMGRRLAWAAGLGVAAGAGLWAGATRVVEPRAAPPAPVAMRAASAAAKTAVAPVAVPGSLAASGSKAAAGSVTAAGTVAASGPGSAASAAGATATASAAAASSAAPVASPAAPALAANAGAPPVLHQDLRAAWRELAQSWNVAAPSGDPCALLPREQVHCFSRRLTLPLIRQLGRPGIVTLDADTGRPSYAILAGLNATSATLRAAGTEQTVTLTALADRWQGDFATLWRAPDGWKGPVADNQGGPVVDWVATQLASARGQRAPSTAQRLDPRLRGELRAFQLAQGLPPDGHPGPLTVMQLNRAGGLDEPRLRTDF